MQLMLELKYSVIDYWSLKEGWYSLGAIRTIYLNWIEKRLDRTDRALLRKAKLLNINVVWVFHNKIPHDVSNILEMENNICFLIRNSTHIIIHSRNSIEILKGYEKNLNINKVCYIPHPNYIGDYGAYRGIKKMPDFGESFVFAFLGQIRPYKNIEVLLAAFKMLKDKYDCSLMLAGMAPSQEYLDRLTQLVKGQNGIYFFNKYVDDMEMERYLDVADIIVTPYALRSSMNSGTMIMAYSCGKTTITPSICMAEDFPDDLIYKYRYATETEHVNQLALQMEQALLNGKEENARRGRQLQEIVKNEYSKEKVERRLLSII